MTETQIIIAIAIALALAAAAILVFWLRRGQRVDMTPIDSAPAPTLKRDAAPAAQPAPIPAPLSAPAAGTDDLRLLKGVGPKLVQRLGELGITRFAQIAALDDAAVAGLDAQLGTFAGRIRRDNWVEQANFLAKGDITGFEAKYGKLDSEGAPS